MSSDPTVMFGRKDDGGKLLWHLLPWSALAMVVGVLMRGAIKYAPENWRKVGDWEKRYFDATLRHLIAWREGKKLDPEWNLPHLAHAACCILFLLSLDNVEGPIVSSAPSDSIGEERKHG